MLNKHSVEKLVSLRTLVLIQQDLVNNYIGFHLEDCNVGQNYIFRNSESDKIYESFLCFSTAS